MNAQQIVQFRMYKRLKTILEQNAPRLSDYTIFNEVYLRFKTELARVETLAPQQENTSVGITQEKNSLKTQLTMCNFILFLMSQHLIFSCICEQYLHSSRRSENLT